MHSSSVVYIYIYYTEIIPKSLLTRIKHLETPNNGSIQHKTFVTAHHCSTFYYNKGVSTLHTIKLVRFMHSSFMKIFIVGHFVYPTPSVKRVCNGECTNQLNSSEVI